MTLDDDTRTQLGQIHLRCARAAGGSWLPWTQYLPIDDGEGEITHSGVHVRHPLHTPGRFSAMSNSAAHLASWARAHVPLLAGCLLTSQPFLQIAEFQRAMNELAELPPGPWQVNTERPGVHAFGAYPKKVYYLFEGFEGQLIPTLEFLAALPDDLSALNRALDCCED
ncbi:MAG: hypothetical protein KJZ62_01150 [Fimbriimonadaceae bacterium]|nr:hypothetical protein [Fimbriimonadaceae bacterium]MCL4283687.1 hypothetical protein [Fimbriimonadaceae bacterium]QOJ11427.1 MAG: hypothetical protein HRU74_04945 [Chthonomonadaceae bacterium]